MHRAALCLLVDLAEIVKLNQRYIEAPGQAFDHQPADRVWQEDDLGYFVIDEGAAGLSGDVGRLGIDGDVMSAQDLKHVVQWHGALAVSPRVILGRQAHGRDGLCGEPPLRQVDHPLKWQLSGVGAKIVRQVMYRDQIQVQRGMPLELLPDGLRGKTQQPLH